MSHPKANSSFCFSTGYIRIPHVSPAKIVQKLETTPADTRSSNTTSVIPSDLGLNLELNVKMNEPKLWTEHLFTNSYIKL